MTEGSIMASLRAPIDSAAQGARVSFWDVVGLIATSLFGSGSGAPLVRLADGMTALNNRIDLMDEVSGYGCMFMSTNRAFSGSTLKVVPFDTRYGPPKNTVLDPANHRIYLAKGTWTVSVLLAVPQAGALGGDTRFTATVRSYKPNGTLHMEQELGWRSGASPHTYLGQAPLICDEDGYWVEIRFSQSSLLYRVLGGTNRSKVWVNRWDINTENNNIIIDPPDGPDV